MQKSISIKSLNKISVMFLEPLFFNLYFYKIIII